jgi:hypothetical protein
LQERIKTSRSTPHAPCGIQRGKTPPKTKTSKSHVQNEQPWCPRPYGKTQELFQVNLVLEKQYAIVDTPGSSMGFHEKCHNPSLGLVTKARACKGAGQE